MFMETRMIGRVEYTRLDQPNDGGIERDKG